MSLTTLRLLEKLNFKPAILQEFIYMMTFFEKEKLQAVILHHWS